MRGLPPLVRPATLAGVRCSFPLELSHRRLAAVLVAAPRRPVAELLAPHDLSGVPVRPTGHALIATYTSWDSSPAGAFRELLLLVPAYREVGSPVPGLALALHALTGSTSAVGELVYVPLLSLCDQPVGVELRRDLWGIAGATVQLRVADRDGRVVVQADDDVGTLARLVAARASATSGARRWGAPLRGARDGERWSDHYTGGMLEARLTIRPGRGMLLLPPHPATPGPLAGLQLRALATLLAGRGTARYAGPRRDEDSRAGLGWLAAADDR